MVKTWRCTVCGYLHEGELPPERCPVCHVGAEKFELVADEQSIVTPAGLTGLLREMLDSIVPHAVFAHFPNALIPTAALFLGLFLLLGGESFEICAYYLLLVIVLSVPPTFISGLIDWKTHYSGELAPIFRKKIILGAVLIVVSLLAGLWRWQSPTVVSSGGWTAALFLVMIVVMLGCVTLLGHYGGMLVFAKNGKK